MNTRWCSDDRLRFDLHLINSILSSSHHRYWLCCYSATWSIFTAFQVLFCQLYMKFGAFRSRKSANTTEQCGEHSVNNYIACVFIQIYTHWLQLLKSYKVNKVLSSTKNYPFENTTASVALTFIHSRNTDMNYYLDIFPEYFYFSCN